MKKLKGMLVAISLAFIGSVAFAQVTLVTPEIPSLAQPSSFTTQTTGGVFGTEVDDFMDVHGWKDVKAEKFFGYLGYDMTAGGIDLGFSKQLAPFYLGMSFDGRLGKLQTISTSTTASDHKTGSLIVDTANSFNLQALFGFGIIGVRAGLGYAPTSINNSSDSTAKTKSYNEIYKIFPEVTVGFDLTAGKLSLTPWARLGLEANVNKTTVKVDGELTTLTNDSVYNLVVALGTGIALEEKNNVNQSFDVGLGISGGIIPGKNIAGSVETLNKGKQDTSLMIDLGYKVTYAPTEKVALGLRAGLPIGMKFTSDIKKTDDTEINYDAHTYLIMMPSLGCGAEFWVKPEKFRINLGVDFQMKEFGWDFFTQYVAATKDKNKQTGFLFDHTVGGITWGSGFTWNIAKKVQFDVNWKVIQGIFNNMTTNFNNYETSDGFWGNINKLFFHDLSFLIAVKL